MHWHHQRMQHYIVCDLLYIYATLFVVRCSIKNTSITRHASGVCLLVSKAKRKTAISSAQHHRWCTDNRLNACPICAPDALVLVLVHACPLASIQPLIDAYSAMKMRTLSCALFLFALIVLATSLRTPWLLQAVIHRYGESSGLTATLHDVHCVGACDAAPVTRSSSPALVSNGDHSSPWCWCYWSCAP